ncbi:MAG TPA: hypothetical protein DHN29_18695, partial [Cytophagales bacterium]|nr:hypothetical protein [Cytophagales bacterium]
MDNQNVLIKDIATLIDGSLIAVGRDDSILYQRAIGANNQWEAYQSYQNKVNGVAVDLDGQLILIGDNVLLQQEYELQPVLSFTLPGISAAAGTGSRSSQVQFRFGNLYQGKNENPLAFSRTEHVNIINHLGKPNPPIHFGVVGKNALLNQSGHANELKIYFQTNGRKPLTFDEKTEIDFAFPYDTTGSNLIHFGSETEVNAYKLAPSTDPLYSAGDPKDDAAGGVTITANGFVSGDAQTGIVTCVFNFSNIQISGPDGQAFVTITIRNLPGYWDSTFNIPIHKESSELTNELELGVANKPGHHGTGSRIDFLSGQLNNNGQANVTIEEDWGLNLYGNQAIAAQKGAQGVHTQSDQPAQAARPVKVREADLLVVEGRVSINGGTNYPTQEDGDTNQNEKLNVKGDTYLDGHVGISGDTGISGPLTVNNIVGIGSASTKGHLGAGSRIEFNTGERDANNNAQVSIEENWGLNLYGTEERPVRVQNADLKVSGGRIEDKNGPVMPVGSIIAFAGNNAPTGWLFCDGQAVDAGKYPELHQVVGNNVPDLRSRFPLGAGQGPGLTSRPLNGSGGEETHKLTAN